MKSLKLKKSLLIIPLTFIFISFVECSPKLYDTGKNFMESGNYQDAITQFSKVIDEKPEYANAYIARAEAYEKTNKLEKAADDYKRASALKSKDEEIYYNAGKLYFKIEKYDLAIQMLSGATSLDKEMSKAFHLKMLSYINLERYNKALFESNTLLKLNKTPQNYYWHGFIADKLGMYNLAENDFKKTIALNTKDIKSHIALANVLFKAKKYDDAQNVCSNIIKFDSKCKDAYWIRSKTFKEKFEYSKAIDDLSKIIVLDKNNEKAYFTRGTYYQEFNQHQSAINDFSKVLSLNNKNCLAYYKRAKSNEEITQYKKAISDYKTYLSLVNKSPKTKEQIKLVSERLYELNRETNIPKLIILNIKERDNNILNVVDNAKEIVLKGKIIDENKIKYAKI
ncbi:MAG: tetratricopeptide repeat protein, partial [Bacteroidota bacterium]|nr:tetratricopeptide repeat protein [Bacteroidota bacterium]